MLRVKCRGCGKIYDYSKDEICPSCGAYNRPPHRGVVDADGTVRFVGEKACYEEKVCFDEKQCHEEVAQRVRGGKSKTAWETDDLELALRKSMDKLKSFAEKTNRPKKNQTPGQKRAAAVIGIAVAILALLGQFMENRAERRPEPMPDISIEADTEPAMEVRRYKIGEGFSANGRQYAVTDMAMSGDDITVIMSGDGLAEDPWNVYLYWHDPDGAEYAIGPDEIESREDQWIYEFDIEDFTDFGCGADRDGYFVGVYEYPGGDSTILHLVSL